MAPETWKSGLFDCFSDIKSCCLTLWCPCVTFGRIAEIVGQGAPSCCTHSKMRQQYTFDGSCCGDFLVHCLCQTCAAVPCARSTVSSKVAVSTCPSDGRETWMKGTMKWEWVQCPEGGGRHEPL